MRVLGEGLPKAAQQPASLCSPPPGAGPLSREVGATAAEQVAPCQAGAPVIATLALPAPRAGPQRETPRVRPSQPSVSADAPACAQSPSSRVTSGGDRPPESPQAPEGPLTPVPHWGPPHKPVRGLEAACTPASHPEPTLPLLVWTTAGSSSPADGPPPQGPRPHRPSPAEAESPSLWQLGVRPGGRGWRKRRQGGGATVPGSRDSTTDGSEPRQAALACGRLHAALGPSPCPLPTARTTTCPRLPQRHLHAAQLCPRRDGPELPRPPVARSTGSVLWAGGGLCEPHDPHPGATCRRSGASVPRLLGAGVGGRGGSQAGHPPPRCPSGAL